LRAADLHLDADGTAALDVVSGHEPPGYPYGLLAECARWH
jgi:hypothetical protein